MSPGGASGRVRPAARRTTSFWLFRGPPRRPGALRGAGHTAAIPRLWPGATATVAGARTPAGAKPAAHRRAAVSDRRGRRKAGWIPAVAGERRRGVEPAGKHPRAAAPGQDPQPVRHRSPELTSAPCRPRGVCGPCARCGRPRRPQRSQGRKHREPSSALLCGESGCLSAFWTGPLSSVHPFAEDSTDIRRIAPQVRSHMCPP
jgi:hypothetical protein